MTDQTTTSGTKEKRFLDALKTLFTGAEVEGDSGFVNLMRVKRKHFQSLRPKLLAKIDARAEKNSAFREELFDKLHDFFSRYFCESGSIYFRHLPAFAKTYERVYADGQDVALSWKTRNLYYVKSDVLVQSLPVTLEEEGKPQNTRRFFFDAAGVENKQNNERKEFVFEFGAVKSEDGNRVVHLAVSYKKGSGKTKTGDILKKARENGIVSLSEEQLQKAINVFRRQVEADFFINKDAGGFLREQFDLWMFQYLYKEESDFGANRVAQLQAVKKTAYDIIDFIAQFEDELRRVWEKPKFVRGLNYVVTLDKLAEKSGLLKKIAAHKGAKAQVEEWRELGLVDGKFPAGEIAGARKDCKFLPLDTRHFKNLELDILAALGNLDEALDGEFVHGENWQALNTLQKRYAEKVKCIYIDPPFNLDSSDQFDYRTNYKDSCWATMLESRLKLAQNFLSEDGGIFVRCDINGNWIVRCLLDSIFGSDNFLNEIVVNRTQEFFKSPTPLQRKLMNDVDSLFLAGKSGKTNINRLRVPRRDEVWHEPFLPARGAREGAPESRIIGGKEIFAPKGRQWGLSQAQLDELSEHQRVKIKNGRAKYWPLWRNLKNNWTDIPGYTRAWEFKTENSEELLMRCLSAFSGEGVVCDFFSGSGTTHAVAQKLGRKWLGVEMGDHFNTVILPRMKKVLSGHQSGISKETDYKGGGAFKYYALEQYEETLRNARYEDGEQLEIDSAKSPFAQYVFFADDKLAPAITRENGLPSMYPDIDIAETLANALGMPVRARTADSVVFADGSEQKINPAKMTAEEKQRFVSLLRPYLWWGE